MGVPREAYLLWKLLFPRPPSAVLQAHATRLVSSHAPGPGRQLIGHLGEKQSDSRYVHQKQQTGEKASVTFCCSNSGVSVSVNTHVSTAAPWYQPVKLNQNQSSGLGHLSCYIITILNSSFHQFDNFNICHRPLNQSAKGRDKRHPHTAIRSSPVMRHTAAGYGREASGIPTEDRRGTGTLSHGRLSALSRTTPSDVKPKSSRKLH
ncbi:hypothetical protein RRG08_045230 [Elysia crispata]|uniref:Uncharacterized protein n=1 Tax=Elysia crispata TaxID=231223 RepID=A0AAE1A178_9GAST|nr:hypothetical protein RRG08_045230 [Elysia crispata]